MIEFICYTAAMIEVPKTNPDSTEFKAKGVRA